MILRPILVVILAISAVRCQHGLTPGGTHDALSVGRQGSSSSSSPRSSLVNDIRGALSSALDAGRLGSLGSLGGSSSGTQNGIQQEPLPGFGSTDQLRPSPGGFPQTVVEAQPGQGTFSGGTNDQFGGFDPSTQDFGFGGRSENTPPRTQDSTGGGSFMTSASQSGPAIGSLPPRSDTATGSAGFTFGASGPTGTLPGSGNGAQTGQGQSFGFGAPPTGFGSQMAPAFSFSPPLDSGSQISTGGFGMTPTTGAGTGAMTGSFGSFPSSLGSSSQMTGTFGIRPPSGAGVTGGSIGFSGGNMTPPGTGMFIPQGPGSFLTMPSGPGLGAFPPRMGFAGQTFGPGSTGGVGFGAGGSAGSGGMPGFPRGMFLPGMSPAAGMTFPMPGFPFAGVPDSSQSTTAGGGTSTGFFSTFPGMGSAAGFDPSSATSGTPGFFMTPGFAPGMTGGQSNGVGMFGVPTSTGSGGGTEWQTSGTMTPGLSTSSFPTGAFFPGMTAPGSFGLPSTGTSGAGGNFPTTQGGTGMVPPGSWTSTGGGSGGSTGTGFVSGTGGPFLPPGFFVPGGGQVSGGGTSGAGGNFPTTQGGTGMFPPGSGGGSGVSTGTGFVSGTGGPFLPPGFFMPGGGQVSGGGGIPDSVRTGSGFFGFSGGPVGPFGDFSASQSFDPRFVPGGGPSQFTTFGVVPIFPRRGRMPMEFFIRRR